MNDSNEENGRIFSGKLLAKALRDSGYKSTAYALAELIDNSIQAEATSVEVICIEESQVVNSRERKRLKEIAVIDNGFGMESDVLRTSLMFGNGTHLLDRSGIGRFGMGLPNASFSQTKRVDIWSWQNGVTNALWTYLDLKEITDGDLTHVPEPDHKAVPMELLEKVDHPLTDTGTLVHWTNLDENRITWKQAKTTLRYTEEIIGRIYRHFLKDQIVFIRLAAFTDGIEVSSKNTSVNDPLYLTSPSSTPEPFNDNPMFKKWSDIDEEFPIEIGGENHNVIVRLSYAKQDTVVPEMDRGHKLYGKHAAKNIGVSLVRSKRELLFDSNWGSGYTATDRWWGCEVEFPPALDEIFGVTINKQEATLWSQFAQIDFESLAEEGENTPLAVSERLIVEKDPRGYLLQISTYIHQQLHLIRKCITDQMKGSRKGNKRHSIPDAERKANQKFKERAEDNPTENDSEQFGDKEAQKLKEDLVEDKQYPEAVADEIIEAVYHQKIKLIFLEAEFDGRAFFKVEEKPGGIAEIVINRKHPFFSHLNSSLQLDDSDPSELSADQKYRMLYDTIWLLFAAWARYERESSIKIRDQLTDIREDWGRMAKFFLDDGEEE